MVSHPSRLPTTTIVALKAAARRVAEHAYAPYSRFRVGAALILDGREQDTLVTGCNVENASYRLTTCAEQTAIVSAVALYGPRIQIRAIAVANLNKAFSAPCGACRQTISEFSTEATWLFLPGEEGADREFRFADLLPSAFRPEDLTSQPTKHLTS